MHTLLRFVGDVPTSPLRAAHLRRSLGMFGLALVAATWRLWTPQSVFPQVPLFRAAGEVPAWLEWLGAAGMVAGLAGALVAPRGGMATASLVLFAAGAAALIAVDQQRLQPWAYQFILVALVLALAEPRGAFALLRLFVVSFYFHSALTKLDYAFLHTTGQQFLAALAGTCALSVQDWSAHARLAGAALFPVGEMLVAAGLLFAPTRKMGLAGAIVLHLLLLVILGPWGLDHKPGVLVWNLYFIVQDAIVYWPVRTVAPSALAPDAAPARAPWLACAMVGGAVVLPFLEPSGWFDMWPSWGLYAASAQRVALEVHRRDLARWPREWRGYLEAPDDPDDPWLRVRLDRWSLDALGAPVYPQNRVQLGLAAGVAARLGLGNRVRAIRYEQAARWTGRRRYEVFHGVVQLESAGDEYFFNARPRANLE